jgi:hypothetical protein
MPLSNFAISKAAPKERPYKLTDGFVLALLVEPNGRKNWRFRYRFAGRDRTVAVARRRCRNFARASPSLRRDRGGPFSS